MRAARMRSASAAPSAPWPGRAFGQRSASSESLTAHPTVEACTLVRNAHARGHAAPPMLRTSGPLARVPTPASVHAASETVVTTAKMVRFCRMGRSEVRCSHVYAGGANVHGFDLERKAAPVRHA